MDSSNKYLTQKKEFYCINCGKMGHNCKSCLDPIVSYGIILVSLDINKDLLNSLIEELKNNVDLSLNSDQEGINIEGMSDVELFCTLKNCIKFLLIRRKHTLGFLEFMRGRYNIDNIDGIIFLFKQMTPEEINRIKTTSFDTMWDNLWGNSKSRVTHQNEYTISKEKYNKLKNENNGHLNLNFYLDNVASIWDAAEWGFPKGRRNYKEDDRVCAIREFREETGYNSDEIVIFDKIQPIEETFMGTNGINYRHVYYFAISINDKSPVLDPKNQYQLDEIGDIGYFSYEECMKKIRPYHIDRQKIITHMYMYVINNLIKIVK